MSTIGIYILAKNEEDNIGRSLESLQRWEWPVHVLDSGSTDSTGDIVRKYAGCSLQGFVYVDHCTALNAITMSIGASYDYVIVLDADMIISDELYSSIVQRTKGPSNYRIFDAEVDLKFFGKSLSASSLYPPKPILFRTGEAYFESIGHGERVKESFPVERLVGKLAHDDRKDFSCFLSSQWRYARNLADRAASGQISRRDKLRICSPILIFAVPIYSLIFRRGFRDGWAGVLYALDRLIAEAIMYRVSLAARIRTRETGARETSLD